MNRSHLDDASSAQIDRLKAAAIGFGITVAPVGAIAIVQFAMLPQIVGRIEGLDGDEQAWAVSILRRDWLTFHGIAAGLVAVYWMLAAGLGRSQLLRWRAANMTLALFMFALVSFAVYGSFIQWPDEIKGLCPLLGISDTYPSFGFDAQSSCDLFAQRTHMITILGLLGLAVVLLVTSAVLRIASSRRARPS